MPSSPAMAFSLPSFRWNSDSTSSEAPSRCARSANWRSAKAAQGSRIADVVAWPGWHVILGPRPTLDANPEP